MKFLLTSGGISNKTIENELRELLGKELNRSKSIILYNCIKL